MLNLKLYAELSSNVLLILWKSLTPVVKICLCKLRTLAVIYFPSKGMEKNHCAFPSPFFLSSSFFFFFFFLSFSFFLFFIFKEIETNAPGRKFLKKDKKKKTKRTSIEEEISIPNNIYNVNNGARKMKEKKKDQALR